MKSKPFSPYLPKPATLVSKQPLSDAVSLFVFAKDDGRPLAHKPGQFIQLSLFGVGEAPFSISSPPSSETNNFELAVRKIGTLTSGLHALNPGDKVAIRGPYGSSFPVHQLVGKDVVFVCGGLGYIPLRSLLHYILRHRDEYGRITVLIGNRSPKERIFVDQIAVLAERSDITLLETVDNPDEAWTGNVGVITTLLPKVEIDPEQTYVAMVGPPVMYKFVIQTCRNLGIPAERIYVSLERKMKCGLGKCGHCMINNLNACIDGPVFRYTDIELHQEAI
jgi:NAD(P)H-flavin reductase